MIEGPTATPPPPPVPLPAPPLPVPVPTPPAPVPGPRTFEAPCVGSVPSRGVSLVAILGGSGSTIGGFGATTGVASLLMFLGDAAPSFALGFAFSACWTGGGGGGGGGGRISLRSNTSSVRCGWARSTVPDMWRKTKASPAWTAMTAAIAPPLSRVLRSERYIAAGQRRLRAAGCHRQGAARRELARALGPLRTRMFTRNAGAGGCP